MTHQTTLPSFNFLPKSVLCLCLGNICRSPTAEAILQKKVKQANLPIKVDSAGTSGWHIGESPDIRSQQYGKRHGYDLSSLKARQISPQDFYDFDLILAMDKQNLQDLQTMKDASPVLQNSTKPLSQLALFCDIDPKFLGQAVPDPYYGNSENFEQVITQIESSADCWVAHWKNLTV